MDYIKRIRDLREDRDKTQREIAEVLGTSQTMYARYERGGQRTAHPAPDRPVPVLPCQRGLYLRIEG